MFRKMRREKQAIPEEECIRILKEEKRGVLSVIGDDGYPYGTPINHYYSDEDGRIYFHGGKVGHKVDAMRACDKVSYCVYDSGEHVGDDWALTFKCVIVFGRMEFIENPEEIARLSRLLSEKFTDDQAYIDGEIKGYLAATLMYALTPEHMTGKRVHEA
ncbi:MAG: pyridoxamine 5'-phosphate oxidase family protein [Clostridium sp.]|nr:pyridoxamine 5'-phosphate oxidase family protein [Clostridium sp.]